jgi:hypothetical protein
LNLKLREFELSDVDNFEGVDNGFSDPDIHPRAGSIWKSQA